MHYIMTLYKLKSSLNNSWLDFIIEFSQMALDISGSQDTHIKQLSKHTATAILYTCNGIVSLCWHLFTTSHKCVLLEQFTTDPLEKEFSKLYLESGGTYFIIV